MSDPRASIHVLGSDLKSDDASTAKRQKMLSQNLKELKGDLDLLTSGEFSDAKVSCEGVLFNIHKAIVVPRSEFFKTALTGNFIEASTSRVVIKEHTVEQVRRTLYYIYGRKFDKEDGLTMANLVDLINLGDYFLVDGMPNYANGILFQRLCTFFMTITEYTSTSKLASPTDIQRAMEVLHDGDFYTQFPAAVEVAYGASASPGNPARRLLAEFVWATRAVLQGDPAIEALNKKFFEFGSQVFTVINEGPRSDFLSAATAAAAAAAAAASSASRAVASSASQAVVSPSFDDRVRYLVTLSNSG